MCSCVICMCFKNVAERYLDAVPLFVYLCGFAFVCMCLVSFLYVCSRVCYMCCKNVSGHCFNAVSLFICLWCYPTMMYNLLLFHVVLNALYFSCLKIIYFHKFVHGTLYIVAHTFLNGTHTNPHSVPHSLYILTISYIYLHNISFMIHING